MTRYFSPDIKSLREISEDLRKEALELADEPVQPPLPDLQGVEQLLHMIRFARETGVPRAGF